MTARFHKCPVCGSEHTTSPLTIADVPTVCNVLYETARDAQAVRRGDICLTFCSTCGHCFNSAFEEDRIDYTAPYENALHFSERFQEYMQQLAQHLLARYHLYHKQIVEIGCGTGELLTLLCDLGANQGIGFDPSYRRNGNDLPSERVEIVADYYSEKYAAQNADFICCRHVLEHIAQPHHLLKTVRYALKNRSDTALYFEVPNLQFILQGESIWDLIYEHFSYYSSLSLRKLFWQNGFDVLQVGESYGGQFLWLEATLQTDSPARSPSSAGSNGTADKLAREVQRFKTQFEQKVTGWQQQFSALTAANQRTVVWGAGSKGITMLNLLGDRCPARYIVDINPRKQGKFVAGTGQKIVDPEFLKDYRPEVVVVMNPLYQEEIQQQVNNLGLSPELMLA